MSLEATELSRKTRGSGGAAESVPPSNLNLASFHSLFASDTLLEILREEELREGKEEGSKSREAQQTGEARDTKQR